MTRVYTFYLNSFFFVSAICFSLVRDDWTIWISRLMDLAQRQFISSNHWQLSFYFIIFKSIEEWDWEIMLCCNADRNHDTPWPKWYCYDLNYVFHMKSHGHATILQKKLYTNHAKYSYFQVSTWLLSFTTFSPSRVFWLWWESSLDFFCSSRQNIHHQHWLRMYFSSSCFPPLF